MKQNRYDDSHFFEQYSKMPRSVEGLRAAGEWHELQKLLPDFRGKRVLDLGCGFGWHCIHAAEQGARQVVGIDLSEKMLEVAREKTHSPVVEYRRMPLEEMDFPAGSFDIALSSLALHYVESLEDVYRKVFQLLAAGGSWVFSMEHPVFTAEGRQDWHRDALGGLLHWPVDRYFTEGRRDAVFLGEAIVKYHRTLTTVVNGLIQAGFTITGLVEPRPEEHLLETVPGMKEELRRPMMLLVSAVKP